ncbi:MAG: polyprenol monophosphomannose synthase [Candidatus Abyssobacteria bacterium SURF_5]|uniref:Polyprenol monophosphomannose synthase n=1 Tax=Abyssobacteria bacterium (strain SURF_5) TaxID=2093360 RepID=A0A3A4NNV8_ABYX5|nr:MAG: polyprenol monophosphomannose synthase [Candidatus Abyssubacteria bacterium SURF_5]
MNSPANSNKALVVIPTLNERENIEKLLPAVLEMGEEYHILIVDDKSSDGTGELADQFALETGRVHVLHRPARMGLGSAYIDGFKYALKSTDAQYVFEMDADFSHDPKYLPDFLEVIREADLVVGSRYLKGISIVNWPLNRLIISKIGNWYARTITGLPLTDVTAGYKCFRRSLLEQIDLDSFHSNGYSFQIEMSYKAWKKGFRVKEVPIVFVDRTIGESKITYGIVWEAIWRVWALKFKYMVDNR